MLAVLALLLDRPQPALADTFPITETFRSNTTGPGWILGGNAALTGGTSDPAGDGWLRLTSKAYNQNGYAIFDQAFDSTRGLAVTFEYMSWGGTGADGLTFFLYDGSVQSSAFRPGGYGGSLGYAQRCGINGLTGAYVGIGIDEFGNFSNPTECRSGGPGRRQQAVAVRGPGSGASGYTYLTGVTAPQRLDVPNVSTRPDVNGTGYRKIQIDIIPTGTGAYSITVKIQFGATGALQTIVKPYLLPQAPPATLKMGFAASTGASTNYHEIRNLVVTAKDIHTILRGQVTDQTDATPLPEATVIITDTGTSSHSYSTTTTPAGSYTFTSTTSTPINAGPVAMRVSAPGYCPQSLNTTVVEGIVNTQDIALAPTRLDGLVTVQGTGVPIVSATVVLTDSNGVVWNTTTGIGGAYSFSSTPEKRIAPGPATVYTSKDGYQVQTAILTLTACNNTQDLSLSTTNLNVLKTTSRTTYYPGEIITYTLTIQNLGSLNATNVVLTDVLPNNTTYVQDTSGVTPIETPGGSGIWVWNLGTLNAGAQTSFQLAAQLAIPIPDGTTSLSNYTYARTTSPEADLTNNERAVTVQVVSHPDLTLFKSAAPESLPVRASSTITYTYIGDNRGGAIATGVRITDTLDPHTSYAGWAELVAGGASQPLTVTYNVTQNTLLFELPNIPPGIDGYLRYRMIVTDTLPAGTTLITNTAEVSSHEPDLDPADNRSTIVLSAEGGADVYVQKHVFPTTIPALPGETMLYRLRYGNLGVDPAADTVITDTIPAHTTYVAGSLYLNGVNLTDVEGDDEGQYLTASRTLSLTLGNLSPGVSGEITFAVRIASVLPAGVSEIANTAFITSTVDDPVEGDNQSTAAIAVDAQPDLVIQKEYAGNYLDVGQTICYTLVYSNVGTQGATAVVITDTLGAHLEYVSSNPAGSVDAQGRVRWEIGALPADGPHTIALTATVKTTVQPGALAVNRAEIEDDGVNGADADPSNNHALHTAIIVRPVLALEKSITGESYVGGRITYTLAYHNDGATVARAIIITDSLPAHTTLVPGSISGGGVENGGIITWTPADVAPGSDGQVSFAVDIGAEAGGDEQSAPTLSRASVPGTVVITSTTQNISSSWCEMEGCATLWGYWGGTNPTGPPGWNENPHAEGASFDLTGWVRLTTPDEIEPYWLSDETLDAEWVAVTRTAQANLNYSFFRQYFYLPPNGHLSSGTLQIAGDDIADIYINGRYVGAHYGGGSATSWNVNDHLQAGVNLLAVRLTGNTHGGHDLYAGKDHPGLLYRLEAQYYGLRAFILASTLTRVNVEVPFVIEPVLCGKLPFSYTLDYGDGSPPTPYAETPGFAHTYTQTGTYTATVTARDRLGTLATDYITVRVLTTTANLLANRSGVRYENSYSIRYTSESGVGTLLEPVINVPLALSSQQSATSPGKWITYTVVISNNGLTEVSPTISDTLPYELNDVAWTCAASGSSTCGADSGSGSINQQLTLQPNGIITLTVWGKVIDSATGDLVYTTQILPPADYTNLAEGIDTETTPMYPTAVILAAFSATSRDGVIVVTWETAAELDNIGFNLYRSTAADGPYTPLNETLIPPQNPGSVIGGVYEWLDTDVQPGVVYFYQLEDVDVKGMRTMHGPVTATVQPTLTNHNFTVFLPLVIRQE
ncbi:MAG: carboxypeptidase regulatory-like domain-containing protein [Anaerolineae bacterium]